MDIGTIFVVLDTIPGALRTPNAWLMQLLRCKIWQFVMLSVTKNRHWYGYFFRW